MTATMVLKLISSLAYLVFDALLSGVTFSHEQLPASVEKRLLKISPHEMMTARARIKAIPDMLGVLRDAELQLRDWQNSLSWEDEDKYTDKKKEELESLISRIQRVFRELK